MSVGLFEMCNPHLLASETLADQIKTKLCLPVFNSSRTNLGKLRRAKFYVHLLISCITVELFVMHLSPKSQRIHRDNRRGNILKTRQKANPSLKASDESKSVTTSSSSSNKRASSNETTSGTPSKRPKISWP